MVGAGLLDYVFVKRLNLQWGISDKAFVLGDEALIPLLRKFAAIPFFVLAAKVRACLAVLVFELWDWTDRTHRPDDVTHT